MSGNYQLSDSDQLSGNCLPRWRSVNRRAVATALIPLFTCHLVLPTCWYYQLIGITNLLVLPACWYCWHYQLGTFLLGTCHLKALGKHSESKALLHQAMQSSLLPLPTYRFISLIHKKKSKSNWKWLKQR